jgi:8-hydroxy-5-deazaflavin:NADPH oxidoreductase
MKIGIIGAGAAGTAIARYAIAAGHEILMASRGQQKLAAVVGELGNSARAVSVDGMRDAEMIVLAFPWTAREEVLGQRADWVGKVVIDAINPYADMTRLILADLGETGSSEIISGLLPGARLVKAFNSITMANLAAGPTRGDATRVLLVSSDDVEAKKAVMSLIESFGFFAVDLGDLKEGGRRQQAGKPLATGRDLLVAGAKVLHSG